eukprot:TRINITY_DN7911_c0_g1_i3.p1 TRINITY_DN7911_c0_g1~~TRINITY_DN7911_c0_g1_i3.p1  ORF type:complete len:345 (-),score=26.78 TRINITY_DN7911_c0_g1_i3:13-1047(-)
MKSVHGESYYYDLAWVPVYTSPWIHKATLIGLKSDSLYEYQCGSEDGYGPITVFKSPRTIATPQDPFRIISFGDNGHTVNSRMVQAAMFNYSASFPNGIDMVSLSGDLSYANGVQSVWDEWGLEIQPLSNHVPWMFAVGNHEIFGLFVPYLNRFNMPWKQSGSTWGDLYYSWDVANTHWIALDSESLIYWPITEQYQWLEKDLKSIDRTKTPWVILFWHTPWYCSNTVHYQEGDAMMTGFEDLLHKYKVDLVINGHVHAYERAHPVYKGKLDPNAAAYIVAGTGGNHEGLYHNWRNPQPDWSAIRFSEYGFGAIDIHNSSHLHWTWRRGNDSVIMDDWWFVREH